MGNSGMTFGRSQFLEPLDLRLLHAPDGSLLTNRDGRQLYSLLGSFSYASVVAQKLIMVPHGFITDFASVPRLPFTYSTFGDTAHEAAVIHDYLYSSGLFPREVADAVFLEAMGVLGIPWWKRHAMYLGVRVGGGSHFGPEEGV